MLKMKKTKMLVAALLLVPTLSFAGNYLNLNGSAATNSVLVASNSSGDGVMVGSPVSINPITGNISGIGSLSQSGNFAVSRSASGSTALISVINTATAASSAAGFIANVGGDSAGDAYYQAVITGGPTWTWGIDNSIGGDPWVLAASSALGTTNALSITTAAAATFTASVAATTTLTAGTGITATTGNIAASAGNVSASGTVVAGTTVTAGTGVIATTGNVAASAGAVNAATTMTATLGAITATNGNLVLGTAGNKLAIATGSNASVGTATLLNGTVTVSDTDVTASSIIFLTRESIGTTGANPVGMITVGTVTPGTSFVINAVTTATATSVVGSDESVVGYMIVN